MGAIDEDRDVAMTSVELKAVLRGIIGVQRNGEDWVSSQFARSIRERIETEYARWAPQAAQAATHFYDGQSGVILIRKAGASTLLQTQGTENEETQPVALLIEGAPFAVAGTLRGNRIGYEGIRTKGITIVEPELAVWKK